MYTPPTHIYIKNSLFRKVTLNDILDELERPTIADKSEDSDEDESSEITKESKTQDLYSMPADDGAVTGEDSGDGEHVDISNLPSPQLTACTVIKSLQLQVDIHEGAMRQEKQKNIIQLREWKAENLPEKQNVARYPYKPLAVYISRKFSAIFELFLDVVATEHLVKQTVTYAVQRGNH